MKIHSMPRWHPVDRCAVICHSLYFRSFSQQELFPIYAFSLACYIYRIQVSLLLSAMLPFPYYYHGLTQSSLLIKDSVLTMDYTGALPVFIRSLLRSLRSFRIVIFPLCRVHVFCFLFSPNLFRNCTQMCIVLMDPRLSFLTSIFRCREALPEKGSEHISFCVVSHVEVAFVIINVVDPQFH